MRFIFTVFGVLDLTVAALLILYQATIIPYWVIAPFSLDLILKATLFWGDTASLVDAVIAAYIILTPILSVWPVSAVLAAYLTQKGILSFA